MKFHSLALGALLALVSSAYARPAAYVVNRVTVTGSVTTENEPVERNSNGFQSSTSTLRKVAISNSTILDAMVANEDLANKRGYALVEIFTNYGESEGFYAFNAITGDTVEVDCDILTKLNIKGEVSATSSTRRQTSTTTTNTESRSFTGLGTLKLLDIKSTAFYSGNSTLQGSTYSNLQDSLPGYYLINYIATVRGADSREEDVVVDAIIVSTGGTLNNKVFTHSQG